jgi:hypothetical protein
MDALTAARLQLEELQQRMVCVMDERLSMQIFLEECGAEDDATTDWDDLLQQQHEALQDQIAALSDFIQSAESQQAAAAFQASEQANSSASGVLAAALEAQEEWDAHVLTYDAAYALALANCEEECEPECLLQNFPLDLTERPRTPGE